MIRKNKLLLSSSILTLAASISCFALGFASWSGQANSDSKETTLNVEVDDVKYAGFSDLLSKNTIRFDAPTTDNVGRVVYTNDIGGEQLTIDVTGTLLNYSQVGSISISGSIDNNHLNPFNIAKSYHYIEEPDFEELTRKPTVANPTAEGSYWTSDYDAVNDSRDFEIIASFKWGSFFNYKNPSIFFDSTDTNIENKSGNQYEEDAVKSILAQIHSLNQAVYTLHLSVNAFSYTVSFASSDTPTASNLPGSITDIAPGSSFTVPATVPSATGYDFIGYSYTKNNTTAEYEAGSSYNINDLAALDSTVNAFTLYTVFSAKQFTLTMTVGKNESAKYSISGLTTVSQTTISASGSKTETVRTGDVINFTVSASSSSYTVGNTSYSTGTLSKNGNNYTVIGNGNCTISVADATGGGGTCLLPNELVTMADGTQKEIQYVQAGDMIAAFNHETGDIDFVPVTFNEKEEIDWFNIVHLEFSDGNDIGVITEHGFFDLDTMKYEYIDEYNYMNFIGHRFYAINKDYSKKIVELKRAYITLEHTEVFELPSFYHLNFFADGILSMPGGIKGLFNIFEYGEDLKYDEEAYNRDIELYGLFTYEDLAPLGVTEIMFEAYAGKYLKVALGKGILTEEYLAYLIERYGGFTEP